jgi:transglutaminase-like putative cysteine protease
VKSASGYASAAVAALCAAGLAWLTLLFADLAWVAPTALAIAIPVAAGALARHLAARPVTATLLSTGITLIAGIIAVLVVTGSFTWDPRQWPGTLLRLADVGFVESDLFIAPTQTTAGLLAITFGGAVLLAWTIDTLACTWQSPALALIPAVTAAMVGLVTFAGELPLWFAPVFVIAAAFVLVTGRSARTVRAAPGQVLSAPLAAITVVAALLTVGITAAIPNDPAVWLPISAIGREDRLDLSVRLDAGQVNRGSGEILRYTVDGVKGSADDSGFLRLVTYTTLEGDEWRAAEPGTYPTATTAEPLDPLRSRVVVEDGMIRVYLDGALVNSWPATPEQEDAVSVLLGMQPFPSMPGPVSRWRFILADTGTTYLPVPVYALSLQNSDATDATTWEWRVDDRTLSRSLTETVRYTVLARGSATSPVPDSRYTALPTEVDQIVAPYAEAVVRPEWDVATAGAALVDYLTGPDFTYSVTVDYPSGPEHLRAFLEQRAGFCQQFATAMATMARTVGIASRVVVGFTPGREIAAGEFSVSGSNLHAWVELYEPATSRWLTFDPTPASPVGPGRPQDLAAATPSVTVTPTVTVEPTAVPRPTTSPIAPAPPSPAPSVAAASGLGGVAALLAVPAILRLRRREIRMREGSATALWDELIDSARDLGIDVDRGTTLARAEALLADRCELRGLRVHEHSREQLGDLRSAAEHERYSPVSSTGAVMVRTDVQACRRTLLHWQALLLRSATRYERLRARLIPRSLRDSGPQGSRA